MTLAGTIVFPSSFATTSRAPSVTQAIRSSIERFDPGCARLADDNRRWRRPMRDEKSLLDRLDRLAAALDRLAPQAPPAADFAGAEAFVWQASPEAFLPIAQVNRQPLTLLKGIDRAAEQLIENTRRFARGLPANNALLWAQQQDIEDDEHQQNWHELHDEVAARAGALCVGR